jgi:DNA-binding NtrC family response regulator
MSKILIVDDEAAQRLIIKNILIDKGYQIRESDGVESAVAAVTDWKPGVVLTDLKMKDASGLDLIKNISALQDSPEIIVMTAYGSVDTAVGAMKLGAYDYLSKPLERDELLLVIERAMEKYTLRMDGLRVREQATKSLFDGMIAESESMKKIIEALKKIAPTDATVLIRGESGTGKEKIAKLIHYLSNRGTRPMQSINCSAFPENLLESELFGYEKGAFTGANNSRPGIIEAAHGSSFFMDEAGDMSLSTQAKLLRVLQEKEIRRLGSNITVPVDIRIIAATNKNLEESIKKGLFREDLFYRLNIIPLYIPPLRERKEDIPSLVKYFISRRGNTKEIDSRALDLLFRYDWPGNIRELEAVMERTIILSSGDKITTDDLPAEICRNQPIKDFWFEIPAGGIVFEDFEKRLLEQALSRSNGSMADASKILGMTYRTFQYRANKFGLTGSD